MSDQDHPATDEPMDATTEDALLAQASVTTLMIGKEGPKGGLWIRGSEVDAILVVPKGKGAQYPLPGATASQEEHPKKPEHSELQAAKEGLVDRLLTAELKTADASVSLSARRRELLDQSLGTLTSSVISLAAQETKTALEADISELKAAVTALSATSTEKPADPAPTESPSSTPAEAPAKPDAAPEAEAPAEPETPTPEEDVPSDPITDGDTAPATPQEAAAATLSRPTTILDVMEQALYPKA